MAKIIQGVRYYSFSEVVKLSGVNLRTLRRWISNGDLDHYLHAYRDDKGATLYRLQPPCEGDVLCEGSYNVYRLPKEVKGA